MSWRSFDNDLSDPEYANFGRLIFPEGGPISLTAKSLMDKGIYNLSPFKIVNLQWLIDIGKAHLGGYQNVNGGFALIFILMTFSPSDKYLPIGDMVIRDTDIQGGGQDYSKHWVLLVENDPSFSTLIPDSNWQYVSRSRDCRDTNVAWATRSINVQNRTIKSNYKVLGDVIVTGDSEWWWWNTKTASKLPPPFGEANRPFAAVHEAFLSVNKNFHKYSPEVTIKEIRGDYNCDYAQRFNITSPFHTFNITADEDTGGLKRNFDNNWPTYMFFDIVPKPLIAQCCSNKLSSTLSSISSQVCGDIWKSGSQSCLLSMTDYCKDENLNTAECKGYCKKNDCDTNLQAYCEAGTYEDQKKKYNEQKEICSCFMPRTFYEKKDDEKYSAMGPAGEKLKQLLIAKNVYGDKPECSDLQCRVAGTTIQHNTFRGDSVDCRNLQIQNCINVAATTNKGDLQGAISTDQANNCVQENTTQNVSQQSPSQQPTQDYSPPTPPSQQPTQDYSPPTPDNTMLYIIIGVVLLLIIIGVVVFLLMGQSSI